MRLLPQRTAVVRLSTSKPLFEELRIGIAPLVLGSGSLLFKKQNEKAKLKLLGADRHSTGVVILRYAPQVE